MTLLQIHRPAPRLPQAPIEARLRELHFGFPRPELAVLTHRGGVAELGTLAGIDRDHESIDFIAENALEAETLPFTAFRTVQLLRTIPARLDGVRARKVTLRFRDGGAMTAVVVAMLRAEVGIFAHVLNGSGRLLRWFIPHVSLLRVESAEPLGRLLVARGAVTEANLARAAARQAARPQESLGGILRGMGAVSEPDLQAALTEQLGLPAGELSARLAEALRAAEAQSSGVEMNSGSASARSECATRDG